MLTYISLVSEAGCVSFIASDSELKPIKPSSIFFSNKNVINLFYRPNQTLIIFNLSFEKKFFVRIYTQEYSSETKEIEKDEYLPCVDICKTRELRPTHSRGHAGSSSLIPSFRINPKPPPSRHIGSPQQQMVFRIGIQNRL
jgi:hypothetical protein